MDKDIKDILKEKSKNEIPDLWDKIESKLEDKKKRNSKKALVMAASLVVIFTVAIIGKSYLNGNEIMAENSINQELESEENKVEIANDDKFDRLENAEKLDEYDISSETSINIGILPDLNLEELLKDKIKATDVSDYSESNSYIGREVNIEKESVAIVYGRVIDKKSFLNDDVIYSNLSIEVIKDYKENIAEGDVITVGSKGGEMSLEEYKEKASQYNELNGEGDSKKGYSASRVIIENESDGNTVITLNKGIPQYRVGEYVLVYLFELKKEGYYSWKDEKYYEAPTTDYGIYADGKLYVNPSTKDVFNYSYDEINKKLLKENITTLDYLENLN